VVRWGITRKGFDVGYNKPKEIATVGEMRALLKSPMIKKVTVRVQLGYSTTGMVDISKAAALRLLFGLKDARPLEQAEFWTLDENYSFVSFGTWA